MNNLLKPVSLVCRQPMMSAVALPASAVTTNFFNTQAMLFSGKVKRKETLREREDRRRELTKLMEKW